MNAPTFDREFTQLFEVHSGRLFRYFDRLSGDPELAADLTQDAFTRLYRRGSLPDQPEAWLITVGLNLYRNVQKTRSRRRRLLTIQRGLRAHSDPERSPDDVASDTARARIRAALHALPERDAQLLLLREEGYTYRDLAVALGLNEGSIGTMLARAKAAFRTALGET